MLNHNFEAWSWSYGPGCFSTCLAINKGLKICSRRTFCTQCRPFEIHVLKDYRQHIQQDLFPLWGESSGQTFWNHPAPMKIPRNKRFGWPRSTWTINTKIAWWTIPKLTIFIGCINQYKPSPNGTLIIGLPTLTLINLNYPPATNKQFVAHFSRTMFFHYYVSLP